MEEFLHRFSFPPKLSVGVSVELAVQYLLLAGLAWLLAYQFFKRQWLHRRIIAGFPPGSEVRRRIGYSLLLQRLQKSVVSTSCKRFSTRTEF